MAKEIILYNLAEGVTDEQYIKYVQEKKGPFLAGLPAVETFTLVRINGSKKGEIPFQYVGIVDANSQEEWARDAATPAFGEFIQEWFTKVSDFHILFGQEVYVGGKNE